MEVSAVHYNYTRGSFLTLLTRTHRVELAGHSERAPEVLTEDVSVGWGLSLGLVFHS